MHLKDFWSSGSYVFSIAFLGLPTPDHRLPFSVLRPPTTDTQVTFDTADARIPASGNAARSM